MKSNVHVLCSFFQKEIHFPRAWEPLHLTRNQAGDSTSFASILAMPTIISLLPTCWDLPGIQGPAPQDLGPSYPPRSREWALGINANPGLHIFGFRKNSSTWQYLSTPTHRAGG